MSFFNKDSVKIDKKSKVGFIKKLPKWALILIVITIVLVLFFAGSAIVRKFSAKTSAVANTTYTVQRGNIEVVITGSGSIEPNDQYSITPLVKGEILSSNFEEGDLVEKGDIMYVIDSSDQESNMKKAQNSLKQAENAYNEAVDAYNDLSTKSTISGTITAVYVEKGDNINLNSKIMDVKNNSSMILSIPFISQDASKLSIGQSATVNVEGSYFTLTGTVKYITSGSSISPEGVQIKTVEIEVVNPGALEEGDRATAIAGSVACYDYGTFENCETVTIYSKGSGEVIYPPYRVGDYISTGSTVLKLDSESADKQLENAEINLENAQISYDNTIDQMENYKITAPISGTVIQKNSKAGDTLDNSTSSVTMAVIADMSRMTFDIQIDEIDIQMLKVGQKAEITADAFEDKVFSGTVDYISIIGTTTNGVTSYPVTIELDDAGDLLPGMNVDAKIIVASSKDTLIVPVDAVQRNNIVYVKDDGASNKEDESTDEKVKAPVFGRVPDGYKAVKVTLGLNDDSSIEILSGLKEGDVVYVHASAKSSSYEGFTGMPGGMGGGMPNGMDGGRMPSGMGGGMPSGGGMMQ